MITEAPILITGCARSGSSMIAAAINLCGAFGGGMAEPKQSAKRGMFENVEIRDSLVKPLLVSIGCDLNGQYPLAPTSKANSLLIDIDWKESVEKILIKEGYKDGKWMYKDSRSTLMWPIWAAAYPDAKWVIVRRQTGHVINSCVKTGFMKAFKNQDIRNHAKVANEQEGWLWWVHEYEKRFNEMIENQVNCRVIWPQRMENGDFTQLQETIEWLGLRWDSRALEYIYPLIWGNKPKERK